MFNDYPVKGVEPSGSKCTTLCIIAGDDIVWSCAKHKQFIRERDQINDLIRTSRLPEGKFVKNGRYKMMWIDTKNNAADAGTLNMSETGLNEIRDWGNELTAQWKWKIQLIIGDYCRGEFSPTHRI